MRHYKFHPRAPKQKSPKQTTVEAKKAVKASRRAKDTPKLPLLPGNLFAKIGYHSFLHLLPSREVVPKNRSYFSKAKIIGVLACCSHFLGDKKTYSASRLSATPEMFSSSAIFSLNSFFDKLHL